MAKYATIDVGTNSLLIYIAQKDEKGVFKTLDDRTEISKLGSGVHKTGELLPENMERALKILCDFTDLAKKHQVDNIAAVGTMCLRTAKNAGEFIQKVKDKCGLDIQVISGDEEAQLSYLAVKSGIGIKSNQDVLIFDIGGGSTEFIFGRGDEIKRKFSLNIGVVRFTEEYFVSDPVTDEEFQNGINAIKKAFWENRFSGTADYMIGVGGTLTTLATIKHKMTTYDPAIIEGSKLTFKDIIEQMKLFQSKTLEERRQIPGLLPQRADVILAGAAIVGVIMDKVGLNELIVTDRGVRHGLMVSRFSTINTDE